MRMITEWAHIWVTLLLCGMEFAIQNLWGNELGLPLFGAIFYLGREHAQAEYRYIQAHGGSRHEVPWWCGFLPSAWTTKGVTDWVGPLLIAILYELVS